MNRIGTPDTTGLDGDDDRIRVAPQDHGLEIRGPSFHTPTPLDSEVWEALKELLGSPIMLSKQGQNQMGATLPRSENPPKPWDEPQVSDDELTRAAAEGSEQYYGGSPFPSDIMVYADGGEFRQDLGRAKMPMRGLVPGAGSRSYDVMPSRSVWNFLEAYLESQEKE